MPTLLGIKCGLQTPWYEKGKDRRVIQVSLFYSNKVFHESLYIVVGKQNPDMNIIYLKTKQLLYQSNMAREIERVKREGTVETDPQTQFSQFLLVLWFGGMYLRLERC